MLEMMMWNGSFVVEVVLEEFPWQASPKTCLARQGQSMLSSAGNSPAKPREGLGTVLG
ncbi:hypothetical protein Scep_025934 [Stephania cephalantha]|uniref:Uncharacterized protein n=1 Tax=Stephania cephalantha TaxID=152367 RepID=A0AAP0EJ55_9MAGN